MLQKVSQKVVIAIGCAALILASWLLLLEAMSVQGDIPSVAAAHTPEPSSPQSGRMLPHAFYNIASERNTLGGNSIEIAPDYAAPLASISRRISDAASGDDSHGQKSVNTTAIAAGERFTYTVVLTDAVSGMATVRMTDTLPTGTMWGDYLTATAGTLNTSGSTNDIIIWEGSADSGNPVTITIGVTATGAVRLGDPIVNQAQVQDAAGAVTDTNPVTVTLSALTTQPVFFTYTGVGSTFAAGDWDNDGDLDYFFARGNSGGVSNRLYCNEDGVLNLCWTSADISDSKDPAWADYNGDGYLDVAVANWGEPSLFLYKNVEGLDLVEDFTVTTGSSVRGVAWGDYDDDGDPDLYVSRFGASDRLYRNDAGTFTQAWTSDLVEESQDAAWGDYDGDGHLDVLVATRHSDQPARLYKNVEITTTRTLSLAWSSPFTGTIWTVDWGDYDEDGDLDMLFGGETDGSDVKVYRNDDGVFSEAWASSPTEVTNNTLTARWGDWDGDGDLDIAIGNRDQPARVYQNEGADTFTLIWSSSISDTGNALWADWNGDGTLDLLVKNKLTDHVAVYENRSTTLGAYEELPFSYAIHRLEWGDMDRDGDMDLALSRAHGAQLLENRGGVFTETWSVSLAADDNKLAWGDYDRDGWLDLAVMQHNASKPGFIYHNLQGTLSLTPSWTLPSARASRGVSWADWDQDGWLECMVLADSRNYIYDYDGITFTLAYTHAMGGWPDVAEGWGDYDNDGYLDFAQRAYGGERLYHNEHGQSLSWAQGLSVGWGNDGEVTWADWDGDGDLDTVGSRWPIWLRRNDGGTLKSAYWLPSVSQTVHRWTDWNGDGWPDPTSSGGGGLYIFQNDRGRISLVGSFEHGGQISWADYDNDGDQDVAVGLNPLRVYRNQLVPDKPTLTNHPAYVSIDHPGKIGATNFYGVAEILSEVIPITYTLFDTEGDTVRKLEVQYSLQGGGKWWPATMDGGDGTVNLTATPTGTQHVFLWNSFADGVKSDKVVVRIKAFSNNDRGSLIQRPALASQSMPFRVNNLRLALHKSVTPTLLLRGQDEVLTYTLAITNSGNVTATGVVLEDRLAKHMTLLKYEADRGLMHSAWPMFHQNLQHTGRSPHYGPLTDTVRCTYTVGITITSSPAVALDGTIYVGADDGRLYALTSDCGYKWDYPTGDAIESSPSVGVDGTIYVGSNDNYLYAITPSGSLKWRHLTGGRVRTAPAIGGEGIIYVGADDTYFYAIHPDGTLKWRFGPTGRVIHGSPAITLRNDAIYFNNDQESGNPNIYAVKPDGNLKWSIAEGAHGLYASPAIAENGDIYFAHAGNHQVVAIHSNGTVAWRYTSDHSLSSPAIGEDGTIYLGSYIRYLHALEPISGTRKWRVTTAGRADSSPAIDAAGNIYIGSDGDAMQAYNSAGDLLWRYTTGGEVNSSPAIGPDGTIYFGCDDGVLYAIGPGQTGQLETPLLLSLGDIPPGDVRTVTVTARISDTVPIGTVITNTAILSATNLASVITATSQATVTTSLYVTATAPPANALHITPSTTVSATFNRAFDPASVTTRTFSVWGKQTGVYTGVGRIAGNFQLPSTYVFTPAHNFKPGEEVIVNLSDGIRATNGISLTPYTWQFRAAVAGGSGVFTDSGQNSSDLESEGVALGDLDGDGDLDVFIANGTGGGGQLNQVWQNDGTGVFIDTGQQLGNARSLDVALGDVDGDGDLDAFVANAGSNVVWFNNGSGIFTNSIQALGTWNSDAVALGDVDGDGDLDALVGNHNDGEPNKIWLNDGDGYFYDSGQSMGPAWIRDVALGDLDGDGDLDGVIQTGIWFNQGMGDFIHSGQEFSSSIRSVDLVDLDDDGDLDIFIGNDSEPNQVWLNDGTGVFNNTGQVVDTSARNATLGDIDGDGDLDAFLLHYWEAPNKIWLNNGKGFFTDSGQNLGSSRSVAVALGDIDGDGDLDAFVGNSSNVHNINKIYLNQPATCHVRLNDSPNAYPTVQSAIDAAQDGDTVKVAGTCTGVQSRGGLSQTAYISKTITLRGGYTTTNWTTSNPVSYPTTLDAQGLGRVVLITGTLTTTIEGLTLANGDATGLTGGPAPGNPDAGGGLYVYTGTTTVQHCLVTSNTAQVGGGIYIGFGSSVVQSSTLTNNWTAGFQDRGGGVCVYSATATLQDNLIFNNAVERGGGVYVGYSGPTIRDNVIYSNTASSAGGGVYNYDGAPVIQGNEIYSSTATQGGGVSSQGGAPIVQGNTIHHNHVTAGGGGIFSNGGHLTAQRNVIYGNTADWGGGLGSADTTTVQNSLFYDNRARLGGGLGATTGWLTVWHATIYSNTATESGGGIYSSYLVLSNTIVVSNTGGGIDSSSSSTLDYNNVWNNGTDYSGVTSGTHSLSADPLFVDAGGRDFHLAPGSPCIDAGDPDTRVSSDLENSPRPLGNGYDMGAYEAMATSQLCHVRLNDSPNAYPTVQAAIDAAQEGDTVKVAGTCTGVQSRGGLSQTAYISKSITLRGGYTTTNWTTSNPVSYPTTLDVQEQGRVMYVTGGITPTIDGFFITGGSTSGGGGNDYGGGIYVGNAHPILANMIVSGNLAASDGGGIYFADGDDIVLDYLTIRGNQALSGNGGGLYLRLFGNGVLRHSIIVDNYASTGGGGLFVNYPSDGYRLENSIVASNSVGSGTGSGAYLLGSHGEIAHVTIVSNTGGNKDALFVYGSGFVVKNSIIASHTLGIRVQPNYHLEWVDKNIIWNSGDPFYGGGGGAVLGDNYTDCYPAFVHPASYDYHLTTSSCAIDAGATITTVTTDFEGDPRPMGAGYDIGADEYIETQIIAPEFVALTGPHTGWTQTPYIFTATVNPTVTMPITYVWQSDVSDASHRDVARLTDTVTFTWTKPGLKPITVTASNRAGSVIATTTVEISNPPPPPPPPLDAVTIHGPTSGAVNTRYVLTAAVRPITAATPISYTWMPIPRNGQGQSWAEYVGAAAGPHPITVTAQNAGGVATDTHTLTFSQPPDPCPTAVQDVTLLGPGEGYTGTAYAFTAVLTPAGATLPYTYTWAPSPDAGQGTDTVTYTWGTPGARTVTVTAVNCGATVQDTHDLATRSWPTPVLGDIYEPDDTCAAAEQALRIPTDGTVQHHTFHARGDEDWVRFSATADMTYTIQAQVPPTSPANLTLELHGSCASDPIADDEPAFSPAVQMTFVAPQGGDYFIRLRNTPDTVYGSDVAYRLSVHALSEVDPSGALVIVAGKRSPGDPQQANIDHVAHSVYQYALGHGCRPEDVYYLTTDPQQPGSSGPPSRAALQHALTTWAASNDRVNADWPFTLFMVDHGDMDRFYLNGVTETVSPSDLDTWLAQIEDQTGARTNTIIEACKSGSFITRPTALSAPGRGRVIIASTGAANLAYASEDGAIFSDALLSHLADQPSLATAFESAGEATRQARADQTPWLDDDGDGQPNSENDGARAALRSFACQPIASPRHAPHVAQVQVKRLSPAQGQGEIWAQAFDDREVERVWAIITPPSYRPATPGDELTPSPSAKLVLRRQGDDWYGERYTAFDEVGLYRVVIYARDDEGLLGQSREMQVAVPEDYGHIRPDELPTTLHIPIGSYTMTVDMPVGAFTTTTSFTHTGFTSLDTEPPSAFQFAGRGLELTAHQWGALQPGLPFEHPITITVRYSDEDVEGLDEESLALYYRDGDAWRTDGLTVTRRLTATNEVVVRAGHLTAFGLFGKDRGYRVYLPLVLRE